MAISIEFQKRITDLVDESNTKKSELPALMSVDYSSLSNVEQLTNVFPATSSIICAYTFVLLL